MKLSSKQHFTRGFFVGAIAVALALGGAAFAYDQPVRTPKTKALSCATTATQIGDTTKSDAFVIANPSATAVFIGGSDVTTSTGLAICTDSASCTRSDFSADAYGGEFYCIVASGTVATRVLEGAL